MIDGEALYGLHKHQLIFPAGSSAFRSEVIREQVRYLVQRYTSVQRINWITPTLCGVLLSDGTERAADFKQLAPPAEIRPEHLVTAHGPERPKQPRRTIPHVSQGGPVPGTSKKKRKAKPGDPRPPRTTIKAPATAKGARPRSGKGLEKQVAPRSSGPSVRVESAFELAFAQAREEREMDGSRQWSGYRDVGSGQFGSHPAFDPADDSE